MPRWEEAHDGLVDAYRFNNSDTGRLYTQGFVESFTSKAPPPPSDVKGTIADPEMVGKIIPALLWNADPVYIEPEMQMLWEAATKSFSAEPLRETDLITRTGFVWLPSPFLMEDVNHKTTSMRAFAWHVTSDSGLIVFAFHRQGDIDDFDDGPPYPGMRITTGDIIVSHYMPWPFDTAPGVGDIDKDDPRNLQRPIQCLWRLLSQTITTKAGEMPSRAFRRRAERAKFPHRRVTVVTLRRPNQHEPSGEHTTVEWTHRWIVAGHWRNQPYPSLGISRQIWISPFVKGPDDLPLVMPKERVFQLVR